MGGCRQEKIKVGEAGSKAVISRKCLLEMLNAQSHQVLSMRGLFCNWVMLKTTTTLFFCVCALVWHLCHSFLLLVFVCKVEKGIYASWWSWMKCSWGFSWIIKISDVYLGTWERVGKYLSTGDWKKEWSTSIFLKFLCLLLHSLVVGKFLWEKTGEMVEERNNTQRWPTANEVRHQVQNSIHI